MGIRIAGDCKGCTIHVLPPPSLALTSREVGPKKSEMEEVVDVRRATGTLPMRDDG